jgi:hypothetical protein
MGAIDGGGAPQIVGGQMGGMSIGLLHNGCIEPPTHRQEHAAAAGGAPAKAAAIKAETARSRLSIPPSPG